MARREKLFRIGGGVLHARIGDAVHQREVVGCLPILGRVWHWVVRKCGRERRSRPRIGTMVRTRPDHAPNRQELGACGDNVGGLGRGCTVAGETRHPE